MKTIIVVFLLLLPITATAQINRSESAVTVPYASLDSTIAIVNEMYFNHVAYEIKLGDIWQQGSYFDPFYFGDVSFKKVTALSWADWVGYTDLRTGEARKANNWDFVIESRLVYRDGKFVN